MCGDGYLVEAGPQGIFISVTDGLGHGASAAEASTIALTTLKAHLNQSLPSLLELCDRALTGSRGVVMTLAHLDPQARTLTWIGIGNITSILVRNAAHRYGQVEEVLPFGGVVGHHQLPTRPPETLKLDPGDLLILATDGVLPGFADKISLSATPEEIAEKTLNGHARPDDDALVLVLRYLGGTP